jgi:uncharacterized protein
MKLKAFVIACGLVVCLLTQTAVAKYCKTYELSGSNNRVALAATNFTVTNDGPQGAAIVTFDNQDIQVVAPVKIKEVTSFFGDVRERYFLTSGMATVTVCSLVDEIDDATAAFNRGDYVSALPLLQPLAEKGNAVAQGYLGILYEWGLGVPLDHANAVKWYRLAAEQGNSEAQEKLGNMYYSGQGVAQDYTEAASLYQLAADQGNAGAQHNRGVVYREGQGVQKDFFEASKWFRKAADQGLASAQLNLGALYINGQGVPQDFVQAHMWLSLAAVGFPASDTGGCDFVARNLLLVVKKLTPTQIAEAERLAQEWLAVHHKK